MKEKLGSIIVQEDIDFMVVGKYLLRGWYFLLIALIFGLFLGFGYGKTRTPLYEMQATLSIPESWKYSAEYPDSIMFQLVKQYLAQVNSDATVVWIARPVNEKGNMMNALVAVDLKVGSVEEGTKRLNGILAGLKESSAMQQVISDAQRKNAMKITELSDSKDAFLASAPQSEGYNETLRGYFDDIEALSTYSGMSNEIVWLTGPGIVAVKNPKSATIYALLGGVALTAITALVLLIPGLTVKKR